MAKLFKHTNTQMDIQTNKHTKIHTHTYKQTHTQTPIQPHIHTQICIEKKTIIFVDIWLNSLNKLTHK